MHYGFSTRPCLATFTKYLVKLGLLLVLFLSLLALKSVDFDKKACVCFQSYSEAGSIDLGQFFEFASADAFVKLSSHLNFSFDFGFMHFLYENL